MNKRKVCALGMAFMLAGCSAGGSGSGKEQTLTVGLFTEMNGDFLLCIIRPLTITM